MDRRYKKRINRYWAKMEKKGWDALGNLDPDEWFDLWHTHLDWDGKGNTRPENRNRCIELVYKMLEKAEELTKHRGREVQCFAILHPNTMDNAVYIHSENPNGSVFPFQFESVRWGYRSLEIERIVDMGTYEVGELESTVYVRRA